jgi:hypothetical protein
MCVSSARSSVRTPSGSRSCSPSGNSKGSHSSASVRRSSAAMLTFASPPLADVLETEAGKSCQFGLTEAVNVTLSLKRQS